MLTTFLYSDDQILPSLDATTFVDALVADNVTDDFPARPVDGFGSTSRSSTPLVPPGFSLPHAHPPSAARDDTVPKPTSRIVPTSAPFTPRNLLPGNATAFSPATPAALPARKLTPSLPESSTSQAKQDLKTLATNTGLSKAIASQASQPILLSEDFPALDSGKGKTVSAVTTPKPVSGATQTVLSKKSTATSAVKPSQPSAKASEKRSMPSLNISVPAKPSAKASAVLETPAKEEPTAFAFPPLPASTTPAINSPIVRNVPKTLRLTSTPKTEAPPVVSAASSSVTSAVPPYFPASRQGNLASGARMDRPGTPTSEIISDNASITSASLSRASSPPPPKIGSAPLRTTTKASQKKMRQAQKGKDRAEIEAAPKVEPEVEIAPIMGRKKKQKKERAPHSAAGGSTPAASRPVSPTPAMSATEETKPSTIAEEKVGPVVQAETEQQVSSRQAGKATDAKNKGKGKAPQRPLTPEPPSASTEIEEGPTEKPLPTPASVLQDLISAGYISDANDLQFLKNPASTYRHNEMNAEVPAPSQKLTITPEDRQNLLLGQPVHKLEAGSQRYMLTPNGDCVRNLTSEEEERYLGYQARLAEDTSPAVFVSAKHNNTNGFTLIGGRAVPNGPPSFFPTTKKGSTTLDPVSKIQRDEALNYINQFVLPSLASNTQLEKALNANALERVDTDSAAAWSSWGTDPASPPPPSTSDLYINGTINREGMIATGLENMTAQFAVSGGEVGRGGQPLSNVNRLSEEDASSAMQVARKEAEALEKRLNALIKKNRRLLLGAAGGH